MFCQTCGKKNPEDSEYCGSCHQKLLVLSGPFALEEQEAYDSNPEEQFSFDEHLLERISILEEVVKRAAETLRQVLGSLHKLERKTLVNQTGLSSLQEVLDEGGVVAREEWNERWDSRLDRQLLTLEMRERFSVAREAIASLYQGEDRGAFLRLLEAADHALVVFDGEGAMWLLEEALSADPENHELSFFLAEARFNEGDGGAALAYFERVLASRPEHYESLVYGGVLCHEAGESERARKLLGWAASLYPDAFLPAFSLGAVCATMGAFEEAAGHLGRAVELDPMPQALYLLGSCWRELGRLGAAIRHLEAAIEADPASADALSLLGLVYLERGWYRKAQEAFRTAQEMNPDRLHYHDLVELLSGMQEGTLGEVEGEAATWLQRAEASLGRGQVKRALGLYQRALAEQPENPALLMAYAMACLEMDRAQEVKGAVDKLLGLDPGERLKATAYATLIESLRTQGRYLEGDRVGRLLLSEGSSDLSKSIAYYELAFNSVEVEEDLDEALRLARLALEHSPPEIRRFPLAALGWVHYKRQELDEAVDCLTRSSELGPSARTLTHLGMALLASGEREEARDVLVHAHNLNGRQIPVGERLLECLREGARLYDEVESKAKK